MVPSQIKSPFNLVIVPGFYKKLQIVRDNILDICLIE